MLSKNMKIEEFLEKYETHDPRMYNIKHDLINNILSFKLENVEWIQENNEKQGKFFTSLDLVFHGVENFNISKNYSVKTQRTLTEIDESILGINFEGGNTVSIVTDEDDAITRKSGGTVIKFVATSVDVAEITNQNERKRILGIKK